MPLFKSSLLISVMLISMPLWAVEPTTQPIKKPGTTPTTESSTPHADLPDPVAVVNGVSLPKALIEAYVQRHQRQAGNKQAIDMDSLISDLVNQELLLQEAEHEKLLEQDAELALQLEISRRNLITTAAVHHLFEAQPLGDEILTQEYEKLLPTLVTPEYKVRHILVDNEDEAKQLIQELKEGADFSELAKAHSSDNSAQRGGDLGWFSADIMPEPFSQAVAGLKKGTFTQQPVKTRFGWHIIYLDDSRTTEAPSLEELRPRLVQMVQERTLQDHLQKLRESAQIDIKSSE
ncbi:MAG: peptidylprolyl isomerase [Gammaproteobacteria bacterium]|nr:peptidylprolyl isomerase [Gammaproteobacteria bacterium]MCP5423812.1 peptidylprolyl isomerase [Gammaproteobacteria bacterium]